MSGLDDPVPSRTEEERAAFFAELMAEEQRTSPLSVYAIATLVFGLLGGLLAPVFAIVAIIRIRNRGERGVPLVVAGLANFAIWVGVAVLLAAAGPAAPGPVNGLDLREGQCFDAPPTSGEAIVAVRACTESHTGEVYAVYVLPAGRHPGVVELYDEALARCEGLAEEHPEVTLRHDGRVQVMTPTPLTWDEQRARHPIVCYFRFFRPVGPTP